MKPDVQSIDGILIEKSNRVSRGREWRRLAVECAVIAVIIWALFQYVIGVTTVNGDSMEPYLYDDEIVLFYRLESAYMDGDVIVLQGGGTDNVRLVAEETDEGSSVSDEGIISLDEIDEEEVAGRVVLHIGFEGV